MGREILERFGQYYLLDRIGAGGMAEIFRARPASLSGNGRIIVIKRLLPHVLGDPLFLGMFKSEVQVCLGLNHPNVVHIHDFGEVEGQPYLALEYVDGIDLGQLIIAHSQKNEYIPIEMTSAIVEQAARGLQYAHTFENSATGARPHIIHRDISPQNLLLSYDGHLRVIDFGVAKAVMESRENTSHGMIKGKFSYLSPEQATQGELDHRSDVFSLGIVLWELLTSKKLFTVPGKSDFAVFDLIKTCETFITPPSTVNARVPARLDEIVMRALAKHPSERFQSAAEFEAALKTFRLAHYTYGIPEIAKDLRALFKEEITLDRKHLHALNQRAQETLLKEEASAVVTPPPFHLPSNQVPTTAPRRQDTWWLGRLNFPGLIPIRRSLLISGAVAGCVIIAFAMEIMRGAYSTPMAMRSPRSHPRKIMMTPLIRLPAAERFATTKTQSPPHRNQEKLRRRSQKRQLSSSQESPTP